MKGLSVKSFTKKLEKVNYEISPDDLENLVLRLNNMEHYEPSGLLEDLLEYVKSIGYGLSSIIDDGDKLVLDVYTGFSGLQFKLGGGGTLVLIEEMWYDEGTVSQVCKFVVGDATRDTIAKVIELYITKGRGSNRLNPSIEDLM